MTDIEPHIIRDSREGNREAFRLLVRHYQQPVYSLAVKMLCDDEDAKDATQEVSSACGQICTATTPGSGS